MDLVKSAGWQKLEESLSYALGHRIRIEILCLLNEAVYSTVWSSPAPGDSSGLDFSIF
jgi:hypothetical protein